MFSKAVFISESISNNVSVQKMLDAVLKSSNFESFQIFKSQGNIESLRNIILLKNNNSSKTKIKVKANIRKYVTSRYVTIFKIRIFFFAVCSILSTIIVTVFASINTLAHFCAQKFILSTHASICLTWAFTRAHAQFN